MAATRIPTQDSDANHEDSSLNYVEPVNENHECISKTQSVTADAVLDQVDCALDDHDYILAADCASAAMDQIQDKQLITTLLDRRAYARGMQGQFDHAVKDAKDIIRHQPAVANGYLRLGWIQSIQGKSFYAVETYNIGLQNISKDDPGYNLLVYEKSVSVRQSSKYIDFVAELPMELAHNILGDLPVSSKLTCLGVSQLWRKEILECPVAWATLDLEHDHEEEHISTILPLIGCHVRKLTIDTAHILSWCRSTRNITYFSNIRAIYLKEAPSNCTDDIVGPITEALEHFSTTLTTLTLIFEQSACPLAVEDVLLVCPNLKTLKYMTPILSGASYHGESITDHLALTNLYLNASIISSERMESLLQRCRQLRRLVLDRCSPDILYSIRRNCPKLEILGYNIEDEEDVPKLDEGDSNHLQHGLRAIYSIDGLEGIPMQHLFPMLEENAETLEMTNVDICPSDAQSCDAFYRTPPKLKKLKSLEYCSTCNDDNIEHIILQSISECTALARFVAYGTGAVSAIADTLITLPPVKELQLQGTIESTIADTKLATLFQKYATNSHTTSQQLESVYFGSCESITDRSLSALNLVRTLKSITLYQLNNVSFDGLLRFLEALRYTNVSQIELGPWDVVTDFHLHAIGKIQKLNELVLEKLHYISDVGITDVVENSKKLHLLDLRNCNTITATALLYAKTKVDVVLVMERYLPLDLDDLNFL